MAEYYNYAERSRDWILDCVSISSLHLFYRMILFYYLSSEDLKSVFLPHLSHTPTHWRSTNSVKGTCPTPVTLTCFETRYDSKDNKQQERRMGRGQQDYTVARFSYMLNLMYRHSTELGNFFSVRK